VFLAASLRAASVIQFAAPSFPVVENAGQATVLGGNRGGGGEGENPEMNPDEKQFSRSRAG
jgi:hypothetical protein